MSFEIGISTFGELTRDTNTGFTPDPALKMRETLEEAVLAEQVGLDVVGVGEHHRFDYIASTPAIILAAVAAQTSRVRITSSVTVLSSADPVLVFQEFATLDLISGGRAEIIAGRGSFTDSFPLYGYDLNDYAELYREKLELLTQIRDTNPITWSGQFRAPLNRADVAPRPVQAKLPIWVGVGGTPSSGARAGRMGLPLAYGVLFGPIDGALSTREAFEAAALRHGHDLATMPTMLHGHGFVGATSQDARGISYRHLRAAFSENSRQRDAGFEVTRDAFDKLSGPAGGLIVGSPQEVIDKLLLQHELYGNIRVVVNMGMGGVPHTTHLKAIERLGTEVAPVVRAEVARRTGAPRID